jgi:hypothetical protein
MCRMAARKVSTERYRSTDISGDYAALAAALGGYGERITDFMTSKETSVSRYPRGSS